LHKTKVGRYDFLFVLQQKEIVTTDLRLALIQAI